MILKKGLLTVFYKTLTNNKPVKFSIARVRDVMIRKVFDELHDYETHKKDIYEKFCNKDENGKPIITDGSYSFLKDNDKDTKETIEKVQKELDILNNEEVEIPVANQPIIKDCIENTEYKPKAGEVELIEILISALDQNGKGK